MICIGFAVWVTLGVRGTGWRGHACLKNLPQVGLLKILWKFVDYLLTFCPNTILPNTSLPNDQFTQLTSLPNS